MRRRTISKLFPLPQVWKTHIAYIVRDNRKGVWRALNFCGKKLTFSMSDDVTIPCINQPTYRICNLILRCCTRVILWHHYTEYAATKALHFDGGWNRVELMASNQEIVKSARMPKTGYQHNSEPHRESSMTRMYVPVPITYQVSRIWSIIGYSLIDALWTGTEKCK